MTEGERFSRRDMDVAAQIAELTIEIKTNRQIMQESKSSILQRLDEKHAENKAEVRSTREELHVVVHDMQNVRQVVNILGSDMGAVKKQIIELQNIGEIVKRWRTLIAGGGAVVAILCSLCGVIASRFSLVRSFMDWIGPITQAHH